MQNDAHHRIKQNIYGVELMLQSFHYMVFNLQLAGEIDPITSVEQLF